MLSIHFFGVRGSVAAPGPECAGVGGNTSCVEVRAGDQRIVLDAGTGLRSLGDRLIAEPASNTTILLSHLHWDHIQGIPFFAPLYERGHRLTLMSGPTGPLSLGEALRQQMSAPFFPVPLDQVDARVETRELPAAGSVRIGDMRVRTAPLKHRGPAYGFRIEFGACSVVYATDTEHGERVDPVLLELAAGADVLIYDAQYTPEEYSGDVGPGRVGWGHSTFAAGAELARKAAVGRLVLFHHDPRRSDAAVAGIERRARALFPRTVAARENLSIALGAAGLGAHAA